MKFGFFVRQLSRIMKRRIISITGLENLPQTGPVLLVSNHVGQQDPILLYTTIISATDGQMVHAIAKWKILRSPFFRNHFGTIPLYKDRSKSVEISNNILKENGFVLIFPEGKIMESNTIGKVKTGAARMALQTKTPIIPIGLIRQDKIPKTEFGHLLDMFFGKLTINIGKLFQLPELYDIEINEQTINDANQTIMTKVASLANKKYTG